MNIVVCNDGKTINSYINLTYFELVYDGTLFLAYHADEFKFEEIKFLANEWDSITISKV